jgi:hypothetical protein
LVLDAGGLEPLELGAQVQQITDLGGAVVKEREKASASDVDSHG